MPKTAAKTKPKPSTSKPLYEVRDSGIHGKGLFAVRKITKGKVIGTYQGPKVYTDAEDGDHVLWIEDDDGSVYGVDGKNDLRYVNHSTKANVVFEGEELVALRDIKRGEELTHHYGDDWLDF
jgi:SET domain-containing protein